jgi:hypothetical protein
MNMMQMQTCSRCGGAKFFGTGGFGWGGLICNCQYPQIPNPDIPGEQNTLSNFGDRKDQEIISLLREILARLPK